MMSFRAFSDVPSYQDERSSSSAKQRAQCGVAKRTPLGPAHRAFASKLTPTSDLPEPELLLVIGVEAPFLRCGEYEPLPARVPALRCQDVAPDGSGPMDSRRHMPSQTALTSAGRESPPMCSRSPRISAYSR